MRLSRRTSMPRARARHGAVLLATIALATGSLLVAGGGSATSLPRQAAARQVSARAVAGCGAAVHRADGSTWTCTFADNFSGSAVNPHKWLVATTPSTGFSVSRTCFEAQNVSVGDGHLNLVAADLGYDIWCGSGLFNGFSTRYTGGHIATNGRFQQTYGRFEARARFPRTSAGIHGGFWMYPAAMTYGAWPASGEIDVGEWWSNVPRTVLPTLHYNGSGTADSGWRCTVADPSVWHNYKVVWQPSVIAFSIDGRQCFARRWTPDWPQAAPQPFNRPFTLVLTNAVDADATPNQVTARTRLPSAYQVDWVRAWR
ncbi:MAG TPA: glycoside hydrolase family 16 protein [Nocardioides sp.]|nr:glycoside hydrolase family 16 protein [Nocardioides sp.]